MVGVKVVSFLHGVVVKHCGVLKTLDTIGNCQRQVFSLRVSQHMHKLTNCGNLSSICRQSCEIVMKETTPLSGKVVCVQMLYFETSNSKSEATKSKSWNIILSRKLHHFSGSRFSQCFIPSTSPHYSLPSKVCANKYFE